MGSNEPMTHTLGAAEAFRKVPRGSAPRSGDRPPFYLLATGAVLMLALAIRCLVIFTRLYVIHPDEVFQYLEQGHRLAFGSGVMPWEFHDGIRSWLLPSILAGIITVCGWISSDPSFYIYAIRFGCSILSLSVVYIAFRLAFQRDGLLGAVTTGLLCGIWFETIYFSPSVMTEVLASYCTIVAVYLAEQRDESDACGTMVLAGIVLGLALCRIRDLAAPPAPLVPP